MEIRTVFTEDAPKPGGHYSQAVVCNGLVFVAGQLSIDPRTGEKLTGSIEQQTEQCLMNVAAILKASGSDLSRVLRMTIFVSDIEHWPAVNSVYAGVMGEHRPARAIVPVKELHYGFKIEIEATAAVNP
ncbi:MAG TPA: Rid family detoxifying hydrolase [Blastocatellia bacterium]|nr:Rid family detoxifying hydrolase [Blastocatellia bacterium]